MMRRRQRLKRSCSDRREGFEFQGRWITPDEAHRQCAAMMARFDALPKETRLYVYEHGEMPKGRK